MTKRIADLWQDYLFLTQEIVKFTNIDANQMLLSLLEQRETVQQLINEAKDQAVLKKIKDLDQLVRTQLTFLRNSLARQQAVSTAYDGSSGQGGASAVERSK